MNIWQFLREKNNFQSYVEQEIDFLKSYLRNFAQLYPDIAEKIGITGGLPTDTDMTLLLQGMAHLTAGLNQRVDDGYSDICRQLLDIMAQDLMAPLPAVAVSEFTTLQNDQSVVLKKGTRFSIQGDRKTYDAVCPVDINISPWSVEYVDLNRGPFPTNKQICPSAGAGLHLTLAPLQPGLTPAESNLSRLMFYMDPNAAQANVLFDLLMGHLTSIIISIGGELYELDSECLTVSGLSDKWWILPDQNMVFPGLRLLQEFFAYPNCFRFISLDIEVIASQGRSLPLEIWFLLEDAPTTLIGNIGAQHIRLNCFPLINTFSTRLGPQVLDHQQILLPLDSGTVYPDCRVYSIQQVTNISTPSNPQTVPCTHNYEPQSDALGWTMIRQKDSDALLFSDTRRDRNSAEPTPFVVDALCFDSEAKGFIPNALADCHSNIFPGAETRLIDSGYSLRSQSPLDMQSPWSLMSALMLNCQALFRDSKTAQRLNHLLGLFYCRDSGIDSSILTAITDLDYSQEIMPAQSQGCFYTALGCRYWLRINEKSIHGVPVLLFINVIERLLRYWRPFGDYTSLTAGYTNDATWRWTFSENS
ncbi:type VI secretion system baseplate subunit TssF [Sansalvadorimonas sp. 2012CJ34-2]|uniref:Type VI secretion system baseplate subunit TssF n=1 Tax=Parendozoicomonas callyspongiae TaxID=2942213 RepID=A0ABT0PC85_9GAMM|nr:type VI secretion system baseplate subunit TssF [Sansalvadorimonas sp. 2012CJ34-2]MCL6268831.1 type VI secretion system baseplate subunit TssF [Sansalvadorimonas sp. 2012CJ34-2]